MALQASFSCGCCLVSKLFVYRSNQEQQHYNSLPRSSVGGRRRRRRRRSVHVAASVEVEEQDWSGPESVSELPSPEAPLSVKKTLRPLRLAPKPPMNKMFLQSAVKVEERVDICSETTSRLKSVQLAIPVENATPIQSPQVFSKESGDGKIWRRSERGAVLGLRSQPKYDEASRYLMSIISYVRFLLHAKHEVGERLEAEDESFIREKVLPYHPELEEKLEKGVQFIKVDLHPDYQTRCFFIARDDGSFLDFSFRKCVLQFGQQTVGLETAKQLLDLVFY